MKKKSLLQATYCLFPFRSDQERQFIREGAEGGSCQKSYHCCSAQRALQLQLQRRAALQPAQTKG